MIQVNADLQEQILELSQKNELMSDVTRAIEMLSLSITVLAKIKTTLQDLKRFWEFQSIHCKRLKEDSDNHIKLIKHPKFEKMLRKSLMKAVTTWFTLYKLNAVAYKQIQESQKTIDEGVCDMGQYDKKLMRSRTGAEILALMQDLFDEFKRETAENINHQKMIE